MALGLRAGLVALLALAAAPAAADLYRCPGGGGPVSFVGDPSACPGARRIEPARRTETEAPALPPASPDPSEPEPPGPSPSYTGDLAPLFVPLRELQGPWEIVPEAPVDVSHDETLTGWGVLDIRALHYTRYEGPVSQVCSVEIWSFESADRAEAARRGFERPGWRFSRRGNLLVTLRAVTLERGRGSNRRLFEACSELGDRTCERAAARLR